MSKDDERPAATTAAGPSLIPNTEAAVLEAHDLLMNWLQRTMSEDLNGKQVRAIVTTSLQITVPLVRVAAMRDLADAVAASPEIPDVIADALRLVADRATRQDVEVRRVGS